MISGGCGSRGGEGPSSDHARALFHHYLRRLEEIRKRIESFDRDIAEHRLHRTTFPLLQQAWTAIGFTLRATCSLAGRDIVSFRGDGLTFPGRYAVSTHPASSLGSRSATGR